MAQPRQLDTRCDRRLSLQQRRPTAVADAYRSSRIRTSTPGPPAAAQLRRLAEGVVPDVAYAIPRRLRGALPVREPHLLAHDGQLRSATAVSLAFSLLFVLPEGCDRWHHERPLRSRSADDPALPGGQRTLPIRSLAGAGRAGTDAHVRLLALRRPADS